MPNNMNPSDINGIIDDLFKKFSENSTLSLPVYFKDTTSTQQLQKVITDAINNAKNGDNAPRNNENKTINEGTKQRKKEIEVSKDASKAATELTDSLKTTTDSARDFGDELEKAGKKNEASVEQFARAVKAIWGTFKDVYSEVKNETVKRMNWMKELEESGVRLSKGFDESFTELSNTAKLSHDQFAKFLTRNASSLARISGTISDSENKIAGAMGNLNGKYGLSATAIQAGMEGYLNDVLKYNTRNLTQAEINTEAERYIKNLKELSLATGKTVEQLEKENKIKEDSLWAKQTANDPRLKGMYRALSSLGLSDSEIRGMMSGRPNEDTAKLSMDPQMRGLMALVERDSRLLRAGKNVDFTGNLGRYINANRGAVNNRYYNEISYETAAALQGSVQGDVGVKALNAFNSGFNIEKARAQAGNKDESILNKFFSFEGAKNVWDNNMNRTKALSMSSAGTIAEIGDVTLGILSELELFRYWFIGTFAKNILSSGFFSGTFKNLFSSGGSDITSKISSKVVGQLGDRWGKTGLFKLGQGMKWLGGKTGGIFEKIFSGTGIGGKIGNLSKLLMNKILPNFISKVFGALGGALGGSLGSTLAGKAVEPLSNFLNRMIGGDWFKKGTLSANILQLIMKTAGGALGGFLFGGPIGALVGGAWGLFQGITGWESGEKADSSRLLAQNQGINGLTQETLDIVSGKDYASKMIFTQNETGYNVMNRVADACEKTAAYTEALPKQYSFNREQALMQSTYN